MRITETLKAKAKALKAETYALYYALRHPLTPWYAKGLILFTVGYALSPIDLIPDFIPVLGYLDDLVIVPACIALCLRLIPAEVMAASRLKAANQLGKKKPNWVAGGIIMAIWLAAAYFTGKWLYALYQAGRPWG